MWAPQGVAVDSAGKIYVADVGNNRVQVFSMRGKFSASYGQKGAGPNDLAYPHGVAVGVDASVYVADSGNRRVQKISANGTFDHQFAANQDDINFQFPHRVAVAANGNIWVTDSVANRIRELTPEGRLLSEWGETGTEPGKVKSPQGIAADSLGHVYVADCANNRMDAFSTGGQFLGSWSGEGAPSAAALTAPAGLSISEDGTTVQVTIANSDGSVIDVVEVHW